MTPNFKTKLISFINKRMDQNIDNIEKERTLDGGSKTIQRQLEWENINLRTLLHYIEEEQYR